MLPTTGTKMQNSTQRAHASTLIVDATLLSESIASNASPKWSRKITVHAISNTGIIGVGSAPDLNCSNEVGDTRLELMTSSV